MNLLYVKRHWLSITTFVFVIVLCTIDLQAQPEAHIDSIADYEIPYIVGKAQELTVRLIDDLNSLHANIPDDAKTTVYNYIYGAFVEKENARLLSDLDYSRPLSSLENRNPISISKYALDFEVNSEINQIVVPASSFKFTFPEYGGNYEYELYGAYDQHFINTEGDTLNSEPFIKLASYVAIRDSLSRRFELKLRSIVFIDRVRQPDFMLDEELVGMTQKYFEWKNSGSSLENIEMMSDEAIQETLRKAKEKRDSKEALLNNILTKYGKAKIRHDVVGAAEEFANAEKLQRNNALLLKDKTDLSEQLKSKIEENYERATNAMNAWNYNEAIMLAEENEKAMGLWSVLNNRTYDNSQRVKNLNAEITTAANNWNDNQRKVDNDIFRKKFRNELIEDVKSINCAETGKDDMAASKFYFLGEIADLESGELDDINYEKALECRSEFAYPKLKLIETKPDMSIGLLDDLLYFEPKNPSYFLQRGKQFLAKQEFEKAESDFVEALQYDPNNKNALLNLASIQIRKQAYTPALRNLDNLLYLDSLSEAAIFAAYASLERNGENDPQAKDYVKLYSNVDLSEQSLKTLDSIMTLYQQQTIHHRKTTMQDYEAAKYYEKMYALGGHLPQYYTECGFAAQCYYDMGDENDNFDRALHFADAAIKQSNGKSKDGYLVRGLVERARGNYPESKESFYKLLEIQNDYDSNFELGETFFAEGRELITARTYYQNALESLGKKKDKDKLFDVNIRIGQCYRKEGKYDLSEDQLKDAIKVYPKKGEGYFEMGLTYLSNPDDKKIKKSFTYFEDAESKGFDGYRVMSSTALGEYKIGEFKKAKKTFEQLRFKYEKSITIDDLLIEAKTLIALNELTEASANLKSIVGRNNKFANTATYNYLQGLINLKKARNTGTSQGVVQSTLQSAKANFEESGRLDITNPESYFGLSITEFNLGHEDSALTNLSKSLSLGVSIEQFEDEPRFANYFKSKSIKKKIKAYKKQK